MDKKHRLDAPHNDLLEGIEQVDNHSELSALYFTARAEWEGKEIISTEERHARSAQELRAITLSIRKKFAVVGLLVPLPLILFIVLLAFALATITTPDSARFALPLVIVLLGTWIAVSFAASRKVIAIFYQHALRAGPVILILLALDGLAAQASLLFTQPLHLENFLARSLVVGGSTLVLSVIISGVLLYIWTSDHLTSTRRVSLIAGIAYTLLIIIFLAVLL